MSVYLGIGRQTHVVAKILWKFFPFWIFLVMFKFGGGLHYTLQSPLGEKFLPLWIVGAIMSGGSIIQLLFDVPAGHIMDRFGYLKFLKITTLVFLIATLCYTFGLTKTTYVLSAVISTFGWLFFGPGVNAYVLSHAPKEISGKFMSLRDVSGSIGVVLASAFLPFTLALAPQQIGYILFFLLLVSFAMLFFSPKDYQSVHSEIKLPTQHYYIKRHVLLGAIRAIKKLNPASGMLLLQNLSGSIFYGTVWFVVPLVIAHQSNSGLLSIGLGMFDFAIVVLGFLLGNLADRSNKRMLVFFGLLIFSVSGMFLGFNFGWMFLLLGFLATAGDEMSGLSLWSWMHSLDKDHANDGAISGVINLFNDFGWAIGPLFAGIMYQLVGAPWTILLSAIPIFFTWVAYQFVTNKHPERLLASVFVPAKPHRSRHRT